jgi:hypothetical protein
LAAGWLEVDGGDGFKLFAAVEDFWQQAAC